MSLGGKRLVTTCTGATVPAGIGHGCGGDVLLLLRPGGAGLLQPGGDEGGLDVPFLLPDKSCEFIFTLANHVPKTMQGRFSLAYSVSFLLKH